MDLKYFPHFIRSNYPELTSFSNEGLEMIGFNFKNYLENVFKDNRGSLELIWDISPKRLKINEEDSLSRDNSYDPTLVIHFGLFVEKLTRNFDYSTVGLSLHEPIPTS